MDLNRRFPRSYVPAEARMGEWADIEPCFNELQGRPLPDLAALERWLLDQSELAACLAEENSRRYVAMTCHTDDPELEKAYLHFVEEITPRCKPRWQALRERYVALELRQQLPRARYQVFDRSAECMVEIFRRENVPLQTEDEKLSQQYQKSCGAMTVHYDGREQTLPQMSRYLKYPDRAVRAEAWRLIAERRLEHRAEFDDLFNRMIDLRTRIARNAGLADFRDYQFKAYERFDYTPADCRAFHDAVERLVVPLKRTLQERRRQALGVDRLRPWDLHVDPRHRPPLRPFETVSELCDKTLALFRGIDGELADQFAAMVRAGWLDLESRKGKAPGGYQSTFHENRHPFIFMNAVGLHSDVMTLIHECGHAFHALACREEPLMAYREYGMEIAEVASMGMEMLALDELGVFYDEADLRRARREHLEDVIMLFPWVAIIDGFQHDLYTRSMADPGERTACWLSWLDRFGGIEDWSDCGPAREAMWQRQLHLFVSPLYYIEYGIAQVGALQLWLNARRDRRSALRRFREALALGGSRPLPELWATAGLRFDFSAETLEPLIRTVAEELENLGDD